MRTALNFITPILLASMVTYTKAETISADGFVYEIVADDYLRLVGLTDDFSSEDVVIPDSVDLGISRGFLPVKKVINDVFLNRNLRKITYGANIDSIGWLNYVKVIEIDLSKSHVKEIPGCYAGGIDNLTTVKLPNGLERIEYFAFYMTCLESVELPDSLQFIGEHAFSMSPINHLKMNPRLEHIDTYAFAYCPLHDVEWSYNINIFGWGAFDSTELQEAVIPNPYGSLGVVFSGIKTLKTVKSFIISPENFGDDAYLFPESDLSSCTLWVPKGSLELYENNPAWAGFAEIKEMGQTSIDRTDSHIKTNTEDIYDMRGRKVTHTIPGNVYIVNGQKHIAK